MKKKMTRKQILAVLALIFCLSVSIGGAMAYFTDYEDAAGGAVAEQVPALIVGMALHLVDHGEHAQFPVDAV